MEFDFDAWVKLARENPEEFERQRQVALRATIATAPAEHRSGNALGACIKLNSMMWTGFFRLRKELNGLVEGTAVTNEQPATKQSADVISMERFANARRASRSGDE
jgi:hypothetical protein